MLDLVQAVVQLMYCSVTTNSYRISYYTSQLPYSFRWTHLFSLWQSINDQTASRVEWKVSEEWAWWWLVGWCLGSFSFFNVWSYKRRNPIWSHYYLISCARLNIRTYWLVAFFRLASVSISRMLVLDKWVYKTGNVQEHPRGQALRRARSASVYGRKHYIQ